MIRRELIQSMFDDTRSRASWDIDGVCLWGFFFTDSDLVWLATAGDVLGLESYDGMDVGAVDFSPPGSTN